MNSNIFSFVQSKEEINFLLKKEKKVNLYSTKSCNINLSRPQKKYIL